MPHRTTSDNEFDLAQALNASNSGSNCLDVVGRSIQFKRIRASEDAFSPQRVGSFFANFAQTSKSFSENGVTVSSVSLPDNFIYLPAVSLTESINSSQAFSNLLTPSTSKNFVI